MNDIALSIIIPTRNRSQLLARSVLAFRSFPEEDGIEVIVIDDHSSAAHSRSNASVAASLPNCRYAYQPWRRGACAARNEGLRYSRGQFLWFLDDDDFAPPSTIQRVLDAVSRPALAHSVLLMPMTPVCDDVPLTTVFPRSERFSFASLRHIGHEVSTSCVILPRAAMYAAGGWDETLCAGQDTDLFLRVSRVAPGRYLDCDGVWVDWSHSNRITRSLLRQQTSKLQILWKHWPVLSSRRKLHYLLSFLFVTPCWYGIKIRWQRWMAAKRAYGISNRLPPISVRATSQTETTAHQPRAKPGSVSSSPRRREPGKAA